MDDIFTSQPGRDELDSQIAGFGGWFEVDLDALTHNLNAIRSRLGAGTEVMPVVKNNAYGHGLRPVATTLVQEGVRWLMVAKYDEAMAIKSWGLPCEVVMMDALYTDAQIRAVVETGVVPVVYTTEIVERLNAAAEALGRRVGVFVKVDTGLRRVGVFHEEAVAFIQSLSQYGSIDLKGTFSTFMQDPEQDTVIASRFAAVLDGLKKAGIDPGLRSMCSTHGVLHYPESALDMVRPAMSLLGVDPGPGTAGEEMGLKPILTMKARVEQIKSVKQGTSVTYFGRFIAPRDMDIGTLHVGFYDALPRELTNQGVILANGKERSSVGSVSLNHYLFDASDTGLSVGDVVTVIGSEGENSLRAIAERAGWMVYSVMNHLNPFVPRVYTRGGAPVAIYQASM